MTYELVNITTTNSIASYESERDARNALERVRVQHPSLREEVVIVAFDDEGVAQDFFQEAQTAEETAPGSFPGLVG